jgi:hypothetical protein
MSDLTVPEVYFLHTLIDYPNPFPYSVESTWHYAEQLIDKDYFVNLIQTTPTTFQALWTAKGLAYVRAYKEMEVLINAL